MNDKLKDFAYSYILTMIGLFIAYEKGIAWYIAPLIVALIGILKEIYSLVTGKGSANLLGLLANMAGIGLACLFYLWI